MTMLFLYILLGLVAVGAITLGNSLKIVKQYERGVVFRFGRVTSDARDPGLTAIIPFVDHLQKVSLQIITMLIPAQDGITRDNVTVRVDAVIYFKVVDPRRAIVDVEDYRLAVGQVAQTSLRSIIGQSELDDLLTNRERLNQGLAIMIDSPAVDWGIHIDRVEIKDVALPEAMKRSMSRQAEAERERRSRIIVADGELQASNKLAQAASAMSETPSALQLRLLQTIVEVASERNSTLVLPFPVELLRFLESNSPRPADRQSRAADSADGSDHSADSDAPVAERVREAIDTAAGDHDRLTGLTGTRDITIAEFMKTTGYSLEELDSMVRALSQSVRSDAGDEDGQDHEAQSADEPTASADTPAPPAQAPCFGPAVGSEPTPPPVVGWDSVTRDHRQPT
ncbi:slipin family protein [Brevibacterium casei]|nr:slipin family protein [Brevibacterium casei]